MRDLVEEPRVDSRKRVDFRHVHTRAEGVANVKYTVGRWGLAGEFFTDGVGRRLDRVSVFFLTPGIAAQPIPADFEPRQGLLQRFLECPADGHDFAHRFHLRRQHRIGIGKFLKSKARYLRDNVVDRRFKAGGRLTRDVVGQFVQGVAHGELGRDLGDGIAGGLAGQRRAARNAGIHLNDDHAPGPRLDGELNIAAAGLDADLADAANRRVAHSLVFFVSQRLGGCDGDAVAGVNAHRIKVLDRANDHDVVVAIAHDFQFELFPAFDVFFHQNLAVRTHFQTVGRDCFKFGAVVGLAAARAAQREAGADNARQTDFVQHPTGFVETVGEGAAGQVEATADHRRLEMLTAFGLVDDFRTGADHLNAQVV